jgi:two-component system response regulator RegX3
MHKPNILIVEDDADIAELINLYCANSGYESAVASSAEEAIFRLSTDGLPDIVILDIGLPGADGLEFLKHFRERSTAPVIIVSARESDEDKIEGLGLGADDFVDKPFSPRVLMARIEAQLRRSALLRSDVDGNGAPADKISFGEFSLDRQSGLLRKAAQVVPLSRMEYALLLFFLENPGKPFHAAELYHAVWGIEYGDMSTVAVHVQRLRKKLEADPREPRWLVTLPGSGYIFELNHE